MFSNYRELGCDRFVLSIEYPQPVVLSPGMSVSLNISFRPIVMKEYSDFIEFATDRGTFWVPIRSCVPRLDVQLPALVDFGLCPV